MIVLWFVWERIEVLLWVYWQTWNYTLENGTAIILWWKTIEMMKITSSISDADNIPSHVDKSQLCVSPFANKCLQPSGNCSHVWTWLQLQVYDVIELKRFIIIIAITQGWERMKIIPRSLIKLESFGYNNSNIISLICIFSDKVLRFKTYCLVLHAACENCRRKKWLKLARFSEKVNYKLQLDLICDCV